MKSRSSLGRLVLAGMLCPVFASPLFAQTFFTWDGGAGDNLFGSGSNWAGEVAPSVGSDVVLQFDGSTRPTPDNNYGNGDNFGEWRQLR